MRHITYYLTVAQTDQPVSPLHDLRIMGRKDESRTGSTIEVFHHIEESGSSGRVKIRCRLVRQDQRRLCDQGPSHSHPLLLPAG